MSRSGEPTGRVRRRRRGEPRFVIHKHDASTLHYDFRLKADGVLKSWAVPKGPSTDPRDKRLAHRTQDHPLDYVGFEGVIPEGEYGAGTVIVWDAGGYRNLTERSGKPVPIAEAVEAGHVSVWLEGSKLRGGYALTRFRGQDSWLLVKMDDEAADRRRRPVSTQPHPARLGALGADHRAGRRQRQPTEGEGVSLLAGLAPAERKLARRAGTPQWVEPMLATLTSDRFSDAAWIFERKLDGERGGGAADGWPGAAVLAHRHDLGSAYPGRLPRRCRPSRAVI